MKYVMYSFRSDHSKKAKVIVLFLLMVFSYIVTNCLSEASIAYDAPYNALEPYIMVLCNSYFRVFLHFALFLTICYHPNKSKCTTYMLYRCSRNRWLMGEKIYIAIYIVLYHACLIASLALFSWDASYISDRWSAFAIHASSLQNLTLSIPSGLTKYSLSNVFIRYLLMSVGYCLVISNIILALNYRFSNGVGVFAAVGIQLMDWLSDYFIEWFRLFADMKVFFYGNIVDIDTSVIIVAIVLVLLSDILIHRKGRS